MSKRITIFLATVLLLFFMSYFLNDFIVQKNNISLSFNLLHVYLFHAIASLIIYVLVELVVTQLPNETGYLYLALTMIKLGVFVMLFQESIFSGEPLTKPDKASLIAPLFIFLITETIGVAKLLNNKQFTQKKGE
ncbi:DUF6168 family protein [Tenacibaculum sp. M341]|uniref:DUF6168 family protein n=1 Tax=Tenacibaculum sp. M341 TaxID=2530339 RepID=UPI001047C04C|nr:DUF6168 family protein [Tenacibaculum sp. M341]TCI92239.1 hypothetical protein EYW44_08640 [Tenacibaculum sp. M341]